MRTTEGWRNIYNLLSLVPGEKGRAVMMFMYNFILLNTLYLLKPVRDSLFLEQAGSQNLPLVFIMTALAVIPVSIGYSKISRRFPIGWIINFVTLFLAGNLFVIWVFIDINSQSLYYIFYIWVSIYSVLITSQFWLFANTIYNPVQAKKIFGFLSLGAIIGAATGGELTGFLINVFNFNPTSLLLICVLTLVGTVPLVNGILQYSKRTTEHFNTERFYQVMKASEPQPGFSNPLKEILGNNHLLLITGLIGITVLVTTLIDFQFKTVAEQAFDTQPALTSFMGKFYGRVSLIAFLLQFFIGTYFTKKYGVSGAVLILPAALLVSSFGMLLFPGLAAGTMTRGIDQSLKHSIDRTGRELLFIPLGSRLKKRIKVFIDLFVDHGAQGLTGLLLVGLTFGLGLNVREISVVVIGLLLIWIVIAKMVSNSYVNQFRETIRQQAESEGKAKSHAPKTSETMWFRLLKSHNESDIITALKNLRESEIRIPEDNITEILTHTNSEVKTQIIKLLRAQNISGFTDEMLDFILDHDPNLRMEAVRYIYHFSDGDVLSNLEIGLNHEDVRIKAVTLGMIAEEGSAKEKALVSDHLLRKALQYEEEHSVELHRQMAKFLGNDYTDQRADILRELLRHEDISVVNQAISSAAQTGDRQFVHPLILYLKDPVHRTNAELALKKFGLRIFGTLYDYMVDPSLPVSIQKYIPWLFSQTINNGSWQILEMSLNSCSVPVRHGVIKAMQHLRKQEDSFSLPEELIKKQIEIEVMRYHQLVQSRKISQKSRLGITDRLLDLIEEETEQGYENIFRILSLHYHPDDIIHAYLAIISDDDIHRTNAIEFVENLISWDLRKLLLPILENYDVGTVTENQFTSDIHEIEDVLMLLYELKNPEIEEEIANILQNEKKSWGSPTSKQANVKYNSQSTSTE